MLQNVRPVLTDTTVTGEAEELMVERSILILPPHGFPAIMSSNPAQPSTPYFRIDPQHQLLEMMQNAVGRLTSGRVSIEIAEERVMLTGSVRSWHEKQNVQEGIRGLSGRREIRNRLQVYT